MPRYNSNIQLSVEDMDLIEAALRQSKAALSSKMLTAKADAEGAVSNVNQIEPDRTVRKIHDLLGRLHNQKVFYRPQRDTYLGG